MTDEIQQTRYDQLVRRVADIKGPGSKVGTVITELMPTVDVENLPAELELLERTRLCHGSHAETSGAGTFPKIQLFNPANSGSLVTVQGLVFSSNTFVNMRLTLTPTALSGNLGPSRVRDGRIDTGIDQLAQVRNESSVATTGDTFLWTTPIDIPQVIFDGRGLYVLSPGIGLEVGSTQANSTIRVSFWWKERAAQPSELSAS